MRRLTFTKSILDYPIDILVKRQMDQFFREEHERYVKNLLAEGEVLQAKEYELYKLYDKMFGGATGA